MQRIFGPVPSRRLGRSLGIDIIPYKTCTYDCVYCECGATTDKTCERREFFPLDGILAELDERLSQIPDKPDYLTLSGAGEPTLYLRLGELILEVKRMSSIPVAIITNSSLLDSAAVRDEMLHADTVLPSLDTALERTFNRINRPHERCDLHGIIDGLERFTADFAGTILLEILLIDGFNTDTENLAALRDVLKRLRVDAVQLNTAVRPGTERAIVPLDKRALEEAGGCIAPNCEIITETTARTDREDRAVREQIIALVARRPCTAEDLHRALGVPMPGVAKLLSRLAGEGRIAPQRQGERTFYVATERGAPR
ncbi:MAG TPA: radical SAM protein [Patescibacteria group bacterium]|nr:radical SAM protein [Patescibacteria group bacterium]